MRSPQQSPAAALAVSLLLLGFGLWLLRVHVRVERSGHHALARITSLSRGSRGHQSSTLLTFSTPDGTSVECRVDGRLGEVGQPREVSYLPREPTTCEAAGGHPLWRPLLFLVLGTTGLLASAELYRRVRAGESLTR